MIVGAHVMVQSNNAAADQKFFSEVLKLGSVDAGGGFMLYGIPPTEVAIHGGKDGKHEILLMCDDAEGFIAEMKKRGHATTPLQNQGWGIVTQVSLPGGGSLGVYQPLHKRPKSPAPKAPAKKKAKSAAKKTAKKKAKAKPRRAKARRR
jgi:hypothetical protein